MRRLLLTALLVAAATAVAAQPAPKAPAPKAPAAKAAPAPKAAAWKPPADFPTQDALLACFKRFDPVGVPRHLGDEAFVEQSRPAVCREGYALSFNAVTRNPDWVMERLTRAMVVGNAKRDNKFRADPWARNAPVTGDYTKSGYDRGHQAPAADFKYSQPVTDQSFFMSNMSPQVGLGFNRGEWARLEGLVRDWLTCARREDIVVVTGPIYGDKRVRIGPSADIIVPVAYYKIVYDVMSGRAVGFRLENRAYKSDDLGRHVVPIREIETETGLDFFTALSKRRQNQLEIPKGVAWGHDTCA